MSRGRNVAGWMLVAMVLGQLAILRVKDLREQGGAFVRAWEFFGYAPNLIAAATLPGLFAGLLLKRRGHDADAAYGWSQAWRESRIHGIALLAALGFLLAWECVQVYRPNRTFDLQDAWATLAGGAPWLGLVLAGRALTPLHRPAIATEALPENPSP